MIKFSAQFFNQYIRLLYCLKDFSIEQFVTLLSIEALDTALVRAGDFCSFWSFVPQCGAKLQNNFFSPPFAKHPVRARDGLGKVLFSQEHWHLECDWPDIKFFPLDKSD